MRFIVIGLLFCSTLFAGPTPSQFAAWLEEGIHSSSAPVPEDLRARAADLRYVFIDGFFNEHAPGSFRDNTDMLLRLGVPENHIHRINPSSIKSVVENAPLIRAQLEELTARHTEDLVLLGHSKGATETLATVIGASERLAARIRAVFLLQGPFHGTPLADLAAGEKIPVDDRLPMPIRRTIEWVMGLEVGKRLKAVEDLFGIHLGAGAIGLSREGMEKYWKDQFAEHAEIVRKLSSRVHFIRGADTVGHMNPLLKAPGWYMSIYYGENDGVIPLASQSREEIGDVIVTLKADHTLPTAPKPATPAAVGYRYALTRAIFLAAGAQ